jgi:cytochrome P450
MSDMAVPTSVAAPAIPEKNASYIVPKGHFVLASPGVAQMDPTVWQDASIWNPHRWVDEKGVANKALEDYNGGDKVDYGYGAVSKGTESPYQPFGAGRHRCIGESVRRIERIVCYFRACADPGSLLAVVCLCPAANHSCDLHPQHGNEAGGTFPQD